MKPWYLPPALLLAAACARNPVTALAPLAVPRAAAAAPAAWPLDLLAVALPVRRGVLGWLVPGKGQGGAAAGLRLGKKSVVNVYNAPATFTSTSAAKNAAVGAGAVAATRSAAPVAAGAGAVSQDYRKQGQRGGAAASGAGARATATTSQGLSWWWLVALAVAGVGYAAWRVCRRKGFFVG